MEQSVQVVRVALPGRARHWAVVVPAMAVALLTVLAPSASAHPSLLETVPGAGYAVLTPPEAVVATFNERVTRVGPGLTLRLADGGAVALTVTVADGSLRGVPQQPLGPGSYVATYNVVALDGDLIEGTFPFGVAVPVAAGSTAGGLSQDDPDQVQPGTAALRALLFLGVAIGLGGAVGAALVPRPVRRIAPRPPVRIGALVGLAGAVALLGRIAPQQFQMLLATSSAARLLAGQAVLLAVAAVAPRLWRGVLAALALSGVVVLEGLRAHPGAAAGTGGVVLTVVHLAAAAAWVGALLHVLRVALAWRGRSLATWVVVEAYARLALVLFLVVLLTGTVSALVLLPSLEDWTATTYGRVLLLKLGVLLAAVGAAAVARRRHRRAQDDGSEMLDRAGRRWAVGRAARVEAGLLVVVVAVTAALTSATPPRLVSQTTLLPAPTGAVLRVADRVGQVSVAAVASAGRVDLRTYAPGSEGETEYQLRARWQPPGAAARDLDLSGCGPACWSAQVAWAPGRNLLELDVQASGWTGGRLRLAIQWPPQPAPDLLRQVQEAMGSQARIRTTETVTSGFGNAPTNVSVRNGQAYLEGEPWAAGGVTDPVVVEQAGVRTLVFAMPALAYHFQLTLDDQNRVTTARVVTRKNLIRRSYEYLAPP